jgi:hypothetical protein
MPDRWYQQWNHPWYHPPRGSGGTQPSKEGAGSTTTPLVPELEPVTFGQGEDQGG